MGTLIFFFGFKDGATSEHHAIILSRSDFIFFKLNCFSDFSRQNASENLFRCSAKHMYLVAKDQRKGIVMAQLSQRHIGKARNNDRSERESGRYRRFIIFNGAIFKSTTMKHDYLSSKLRITKCGKFFEDNHTGSCVNTLSSIIITVQKISRSIRQASVFVLYNRLPPRPTKIRKIKIQGRPITEVSTEQ